MRDPSEERGDFTDKEDYSQDSPIWSGQIGGQGWELRPLSPDPSHSTPAKKTRSTWFKSSKSAISRRSSGQHSRPSSDSYSSDASPKCLQFSMAVIGDDLKVFLPESRGHWPHEVRNGPDGPSIHYRCQESALGFSLRHANSMTDKSVLPERRPGYAVAFGRMGTRSYRREVYPPDEAAITAYSSQPPKSGPLSLETHSICRLPAPPYTPTPPQFTSVPTASHSGHRSSSG